MLYISKLFGVKILCSLLSRVSTYVSVVSWLIHHLVIELTSDQVLARTYYSLLVFLCFISIPIVVSCHTGFDFMCGDISSFKASGLRSAIFESMAMKVTAGLNGFAFLHLPRMMRKFRFRWKIPARDGKVQHGWFTRD